MKQQIFKCLVPKEDFLSFLTSVCTPSAQGFIVDKSAYKRSKLQAPDVNFIESCRAYYYESKVKYLENNTYSGFLTVLRQISRSHNIPYLSKVTYSKSSYEIVLVLKLASNNLIFTGGEHVVS